MFVTLDLDFPFDRSSVSEKCLEYTYDTKAPKVWQFFDNKPWRTPTPEDEYSPLPNPTTATTARTNTATGGHPSHLYLLIVPMTFLSFLFVWRTLSAIGLYSNTLAVDWKNEALSLRKNWGGPTFRRYIYHQYINRTCSKICLREVPSPKEHFTAVWGDLGADHPSPLTAHNRKEIYNPFVTQQAEGMSGFKFLFLESTLAHPNY